MNTVYKDLQSKKEQGKQLTLFKDIPFVDEVEEFNLLMSEVLFFANDTLNLSKGLGAGPSKLIPEDLNPEP